ncbi:MAG TPA: hypothetical protein VIJ87_04540 [Pyrinomonadaceae bacterium]
MTKFEKIGVLTRAELDALSFRELETELAKLELRAGVIREELQARRFGAKATLTNHPFVN